MTRVSSRLTSEVRRQAAIIILFLAMLTLPSSVLAQTPGIAQKPHAGPTRRAKDVHIVSFDAAGQDDAASEDKSSGPGPLHIVYSDGTDVEIPPEGGAFVNKGEILPQMAFSSIQLADDRQHIGWLADYMFCAQSYPCSMLLVIVRSGRKPLQIGASYGVIWDWRFLRAGKQVVVHSGFPHGDDLGGYALYDTETGRRLASFSLENFPAWVRQFRDKGGL